SAWCRHSASGGRNKSARGEWPGRAAAPGRRWPADRAYRGGRSAGIRAAGGPPPRRRARYGPGVSGRRGHRQWVAAGAGVASARCQDPSEPAVGGRWRSSFSRPPSTPPESTTKCSSGARRRSRRCVSSWRIYPMAAASPSRTPRRSSSVPKAARKTRACFRSGVTVTSVTPTGPERRGSFSSPASMASNSCRISSATRSWRWRTLVMGVRPRAMRGKEKNADPLPRAGLRMGAPRGPALQHLDGAADQVAPKNAFGFIEHLLQRILQVPGIGRNGNHADRRPLPSLLVIEFGDGHIELPAQAVLEAAQHLTFVLERARIRNMNFEREQADGHRPLPPPESRSAGIETAERSGSRRRGGFERFHG